MTADQVTTAAELDALPVGSVVLDGSGWAIAWVRGRTHWYSTNPSETATHPVLPATVLYRPDCPAPQVDEGVVNADRLSQVHADALATLDFMADRMDEFAYSELHSALEDGVLLRDEDGVDYPTTEDDQ